MPFGFSKRAGNGCGRKTREDRGGQPPGPVVMPVVVDSFWPPPPAHDRKAPRADEAFRRLGLDQPWNLVIGHQVIHAQALLFDPSAGPLVLGAVSQGTEGGPKTFSIPSISALV